MQIVVGAEACQDYRFTHIHEYYTAFTYLFDVIITDDMEEVTVQLPPSQTGGYTIYVGKDAIARLDSLFDLEKYSKIAVLTDNITGSVLLEKLMSALPEGAVPLTIPAGEQAKTIGSIQKIWEALHAAGCDRHSLLINLGGGMVCDLGGFAAATYMRGLDCINVPTTLLAQADASVGGKTGFNFDGIKNLIGTFTQPVGIAIDTSVLASLPDREFTAGFGEIIKHGAVRSKEHFDHVTSKPPREFSADELTAIIADSCRIKATLVQEDAAESGARKLLNFGHTVGHALEALSFETEKPLLHGEAVSLGMVAEARIAEAQGLLDAEEAKRLHSSLVKAGLPVTTTGLKLDDVLGKMQSDKKNSHGQLNFTLLEAIGAARYDQKAPLHIVKETLRTVLR